MFEHIAYDPTDDYSSAYVTTSSHQGIIVTGVETTIEYADGSQSAPAMVTGFATEQEARDFLKFVNQDEPDRDGADASADTDPMRGLRMDSADIGESA